MPKAWTRSVPTKTTPRAIAGVLYLPPTLSCSGVLCHRISNLNGSSAYKIGCGAEGSTIDCERNTFAAKTQMIGLLEPSLVITGEPGLSSDRLFSYAST